MTNTCSYREIGVSRDGHVATVEMRRSPGLPYPALRRGDR